METENTSMPSTETTSAEASTEATAQQETAPAMTTEETTIVDSPATYADGKFQSVTDLESSYLELQSTFSKKMGAFQGAPEEYAFNEGYVSEDNQGMADMITAWGAENQMSNDGLNSLVDKYNEYQYTQNEAKMDAEYKKLGENAADRISNARGFLEANLGADVTKELAQNLNSAGAIEAIEKLIGMTKSPKVAPAQGQQMVDETKVKEMRFATDEYGQRKMEDPAYRAKVLAMEKNLQGR